MSKEKCGATCSDGSECNAYAMDGSNRCRHHGGKTPTKDENPNVGNGEQEGNQNATTHGLYAVPEYFKEHFSEQQEDRYTAYFEALCTRYERYHGHEPDEFAKDRLSRISIECVKERLADEYLSEQADGNPLVEQQIIGQDESGRPISVQRENKLLSALTDLKRETRLTLKDMGLLQSPEQQNADATKEMAKVWREELEQG